MAHKSAPLGQFCQRGKCFCGGGGSGGTNFHYGSISAALAQMKSEFIGLFGAEEESGERSLNWLLVVLQSTRPLASSAC